MRGSLLAVALVVRCLPAMGEDYVADFRAGKKPDAAWRILGSDADRVMRPERGGLRIRLDAKRAKLDPVGLSPQFAISGDFEVALEYEILAAEKPTKGYGVGVNIFLQLNRKPAPTAKIAHYERRGQGNVLYWDYKVGGADVAEPNLAATERKKGCIGLSRKAGMVRFLAGPSADALSELGEIEIGAEDVQTVRIVANTGGSAAALDVRFLMVRVRAGELRSAPAAPPQGGGWLIWLVVAAAVFGGVAFFWWRRRRAALTHVA